MYLYVCIDIIHSVCLPNPTGLAPSEPGNWSDRTNLTQLDPSLAPICFMLDHLGAMWVNLAPTCVNLAPTWANLAPTCVNLAPTWVNLVPTWVNLAPAWVNLAPTWHHLGSQNPPKMEPSWLQDPFFYNIFMTVHENQK